MIHRVGDSASREYAAFVGERASLVSESKPSWTELFVQNTVKPRNEIGCKKRRSLRMLGVIMRTLCFIAFLSLVFGGVGYREQVRKQFFAQRHDLFEQYRTNDIHGADVALAEIERSDRGDGRVVFTTPMGMAHELGFIKVRRSEIHSKLGDVAGAAQFMNQALVLLREAGHTNMTAESAIGYAKKFDQHLSPRWRQEK